MQTSFFLSCVQSDNNSMGRSISLKLKVYVPFQIYNNLIKRNIMPKKATKITNLLENKTFIRR